MNIIIPIDAGRPLSHIPVVEFGRSLDGLLVARVGDKAFAMVAARDGHHFLATGWRLQLPLTGWVRSDFFGNSGSVADEAAFRALVGEEADHQREVAGLDRRDVHIHASTPWGASQCATLYAEGVVFHSTASHGGFHLSADRNRGVHATLRNPAGWYEEDCVWAAVAQAWPDLFTGRERCQADGTLRNYWPEAWEAIHRRKLLPGESSERDRQEFERVHADDWIVISAIRSDHFPGFTEVIATRGGTRGPDADQRRFLVPAAEYRAGAFGFVIDEPRHAAFDGPSSFVGWRAKS
ncbi:hypothetical protein M3484_20330 [Pseudomonas sp. GX19020]|uniref:DUF7007 domain-containing protein n=1 Tax=Pseudomonas sp. GX19020 TaxID=2942277 RepID=UPI0020199711|nr:hypothetical protein [Pseudomonas sp. GX19020]MCL4068911.1 hypothetical protein [Pseudomonas sp. GX19020]